MAEKFAYAVDCLIVLNKKVIGAELVDLQTNTKFRIQKSKFVSYMGNLANAIVSADGTIRGKDTPLPRREVTQDELYMPSANGAASKTIKHYTIMYEDTKVLDINLQTGEVIIHTPQYLPFALRNRTPSAVEVAEWISDRIDNISRTYMNMVYIARKVGRDKAKVIKDSSGISFIDNFWIKTNDINTTWSELKQLRDDNLALSNVALTGQITSSKDLTNGYTSLFTTKGHFPKAIIGGYIYKRKEDAILEYPAYLIGCQLGIEVAECSLEGDYVKIKIFTNYNTSLVHASELKKYYDTDDEIYNILIKDESKVDIVEQMHRMYIFNYIIGNPDLHDDNYGILYDSSTFEFISLCPCYDHNVAFQEDFTGLVRSKVDSFPSSPIDEWTEHFISYHPDIVDALKTIDLSIVKKYLTAKQFDELKERIGRVIEWGER